MINAPAIPMRIPNLPQGPGLPFEDALYGLLGGMQAFQRIHPNPNVPRNFAANYARLQERLEIERARRDAERRAGKRSREIKVGSPRQNNMIPRQSINIDDFEAPVLQKKFVDLTQDEFIPRDLSGLSIIGLTED